MPEVPYRDRQAVVLTNVSHGSPLQGRENILYGEVRAADDGRLLISATLEYILDAAKERNYYFVSKPEKDIS